MKIITDGITVEDLLSQFKEVVKSEVEDLLQIKKNSAQEVQLVTRQELAKELQISLVTLNDWTRKGLIPHIKVSSRVRYNRLVVLEILQSKKRRGE